MNTLTEMGSVCSRTLIFGRKASHKLIFQATHKIETSVSLTNLIGIVTFWFAPCHFLFKCPLLLSAHPITEAPLTGDVQGCLLVSVAVVYKPGHVLPGPVLLASEMKRQSLQNVRNIKYPSSPR